MCTDILFKVNAWPLHLAANPRRSPGQESKQGTLSTGMLLPCDGLTWAGFLAQTLGLISDLHCTPLCSICLSTGTAGSRLAAFAPLSHILGLFAPQN